MHRLIMVFNDFNFCRITKLEDDIAELIFTQGYEILPENIDAIHALLGENLADPYMIVIDKRYEYSYSFDAQLKLGEHEGMKAIAIISQSSIASASLEHLQSLHRKKPMNMKVFPSREKALSWLHLQRLQ